MDAQDRVTQQLTATSFEIEQTSCPLFFVPPASHARSSDPIKRSEANSNVVAILVSDLPRFALPKGDWEAWKAGSDSRPVMVNHVWKVLVMWDGFDVTAGQSASGRERGWDAV